MATGQPSSTSAFVITPGLDNSHSTNYPPITASLSLSFSPGDPHGVCLPWTTQMHQAGSLQAPRVYGGLALEFTPRSVCEGTALEFCATRVSLDPRILCFPSLSPSVTLRFVLFIQTWHWKCKLWSFTFYTFSTVYILHTHPPLGEKKDPWQS